jgi:hypothetical protein
MVYCLDWVNYLSEFMNVSRNQTLIDLVCFTFLLLNDDSSRLLVSSQFFHGNSVYVVLRCNYPPPLVTEKLTLYI